MKLTTLKAMSKNMSEKQLESLVKRLVRKSLKNAKKDPILWEFLKWSDVLEEFREAEFVEDLADKVSYY
jgi:predicted nuclease of restriction endonuclease-like (RecB) superfamily